MNAKLRNLTRPAREPSRYSVDAQARNLWSRCGDLNPGPLPYQGSALPLSYNGLFWSFLVACFWFNAITRNEKPEIYFMRAEDEVRTRDLQLGRLPLYQLSYFRILGG